MEKGHVMMVPYPAQGHVIPLLELAHVLTRHHIRVTFVNIEFIHNLLLLNSSSGENDDVNGLIRYVSVPDGLKPEERGIPEKFIETVWRVLPQKIEELIEELNQKEEEDEKVSCLICDHHLCTIDEVAKKMGIQLALFSVIPAAMFVLIFDVPKMIEDKIIDSEGTPLDNKAVELAPAVPVMKPSDFIWVRQNKSDQKLIFNIMRQDTKYLKSAKWLLCTSAYDLEQGAFSHLPPHVVPIGPLLARNRQGNSDGHFLKQDSDCLEWLDQQPPCSVIYVAFGSTAILSNTQFQELALGLEQTNRPFLWVVRPPESTPGVEKQEFPEGFMESVLGRGRITGWAPQQKVLSHPSVACFVSHCGWNSALESVSNGVPILCWPYFSDQFVSQSYICDIWRVGLQFERDHNGNVTSQEFKKKVNFVICSDEFKERALKLKGKIEKGAREGGKSYNNLKNFVSWIQEHNF